MALGTYGSYKLVAGGPIDLVIISPEDTPREALARARRDHPKAEVFAYLNTMDIILSRAGEPASFWKEHETWFLHDGNGARVRVRMDKYHDALSRYAMNVAEPGYQEYLGEKVSRMFEAGYDGVQLDNVETDYSYRPLQVGRFMSALPVEMTAEKWYAGELAMLRTIRQSATSAGHADREIIFNHMRAGEPERALEYLSAVEGANAETWMDVKVQPGGKWGWKARFDVARSAALAGKRTNLLCAATALGPEEALFDFASYLMTIVSDRNTFWYGRPYRPEEMPWYPFYDVRLGQPTTNPYAVAGSAAYRRDFERGVVLVNPMDGPVTVDLGGRYWDDAWDETGGGYVDGRGGAILMVPDGAPPPRLVLEAESCAAGSPSFRRIDSRDRSGGATVQLTSTKESCALPADIAPGRWRVVLDGEGMGRDSDAVFFVAGSQSRRVGFGGSRRQVLDIDVKEGLDAVGLRAAEAGVIVDRIVLIHLDGLGGLGVNP